MPDHAALRRVRIDVVEMLEAGRIFEVAEQRERRGATPARLPSARAGADCGKACRKRRRGATAATRRWQKMSSGNCQSEASRKGSHSARNIGEFRPIMSRFPHGTARDRVRCGETSRSQRANDAADGCVTTNGRENAQARHWPARLGVASRSAAYFAAFGSGAGLSDFEFR